GESSRLVGGADADLVIDGMLIDVKTVKNFELTRDQFNQLMGYFALHELSGFNSGRRKQAITAVAIYFARHAHLEVFDVRTIINADTFPAFLDWFADRAARAEGPPVTARAASRTDRVGGAHK